MKDLQRLWTWLRRAAPRKYDLVRALLMATVAQLAGVALFVGALALLVVSAQRPELRAIGAFLVAIELVAFLRSPLRFAERLSTHRLGFAAVSHWRRWLMVTVGGWSYSRWQRYGAGDVLERSLTDTEELQDLWLRGVVPALSAVAVSAVGDAAIVLMPPRAHWWLVALGVALVQAVGVAALLGRIGAQVRADEQLRAARGDYVATLVGTGAAALEIESLGASDFLRGRDAAAVERLSRAEEHVRRVRRRDVAVVVVGPLAALAVVGAAHPHGASVWLIVAALVAMSSVDTLATVRAAVHTAVAVTGGAQRLDDLSDPRTTPTAPWPTDSTVSFQDVAVSTLAGASAPVSGVVAPGRRLGVRGPSGAGKSTLLRALAGLDDATGRIDVGPTPLVEIAEEQLRSHLVLVPSEPALVRGYVRDVVTMGSTGHDEVVAVLSRLGIDATLNQEWTELSRGERQRVAIALAGLRSPDVLLLDEPTSALGETETTVVLEYLSTLDASVIVASHDDRVLGWCDEVLDLSAPRG